MAKPFYFSEKEIYTTDIDIISFDDGTVFSAYNPDNRYFRGTYILGTDSSGKKYGFDIDESHLKDVSGFIRQNKFHFIVLSESIDFLIDITSAIDTTQNPGCTPLLRVKERDFYINAKIREEEREDDCEFHEMRVGTIKNEKSNEESLFERWKIECETLPIENNERIVLYDTEN